MRTHKGHGDILVVDDDSATVDLLVELLSDTGYTVGRALNGAEALMAVVDYLPALAVLDLWMPEVNGAFVSRELRRHHSFACFALQWS